jgi:hypothetical protein
LTLIQEIHLLRVAIVDATAEVKKLNVAGVPEALAELNANIKALTKAVSEEEVTGIFVKPGEPVPH